jgi:hypothetical protein
MRVVVKNADRDEMRISRHFAPSTQAGPALNFYQISAMHVLLIILVDMHRESRVSWHDGGKKQSR